MPEYGAPPVASQFGAFGAGPGGQGGLGGAPSLGGGFRGRRRKGKGLLGLLLAQLGLAGPDGSGVVQPGAMPQGLAKGIIHSFSGSAADTGSPIRQIIAQGMG